MIIINGKKKKVTFITFIILLIERNKHTKSINNHLYLKIANTLLKRNKSSYFSFFLFETSCVFCQIVFERKNKRVHHRQNINNLWCAIFNQINNQCKYNKDQGISSRRKVWSEVKCLISSLLVLGKRPTVHLKENLLFYPYADRRDLSSVFLTIFFPLLRTPNCLFQTIQQHSRPSVIQIWCSPNTVNYI
jgi:hypothetical protein